MPRPGTNTDRDKVWDAALKLRENHTSRRDGFHIRDVQEQIAGDVNQKVVENTLNTMASYGHLKKEGGGWQGKDTFWKPAGAGSD